MNARKLYVVGYVIDGHFFNRGVCVQTNKHINKLSIVVMNMDNNVGFGYMYIYLIGKSGEVYRAWRTTRYFRINPNQRVNVDVYNIDLQEDTCYIKAYLYAYY